MILATEAKEFPSQQRVGNQWSIFNPAGKRTALDILNTWAASQYSFVWEVLSLVHQNVSTVHTTPRAIGQNRSHDRSHQPHGFAIVEATSQEPPSYSLSN